MICGIFLAADISVPAWAVVVGRWIPALVSLAVLWPVLFRPGGIREVLVPAWGLRRGRGTRRRAVLMSAFGVGIVAVVAVVTAALSAEVGALDLLPWSAIGVGLVLLLPLIPLIALSTVGEEVVWRSHLPQLLGGEFWRRSVLVAFVWAAFHVPLHLTYVLQSDMTFSHAAATTVGLIPLSLLLSALAAQQRSVWPAVIAHAVPLSAVAFAVDSAAIDPAAMWTVTLIGSVLMLSAAMALAPAEGGEPDEDGR